MAYVSETTQFLQAFLQQHPEVVEDQKRGRALWWDKPQDASEQAQFQEARVPQQAYVYQTKL